VPHSQAMYGWLMPKMCTVERASIRLAKMMSTMRQPARAAPAPVQLSYGAHNMPACLNEHSGMAEMVSTMCQPVRIAQAAEAEERVEDVRQKAATHAATRRVSNASLDQASAHLHLHLHLHLHTHMHPFTCTPAPGRPSQRASPRPPGLWTCRKWYKMATSSPAE